MGKTLQICAVAVLIIIAVPIVVGFALPGEESERTYWGESESHSLTDALRNGSEDYYVVSSSVSNNRWLLDGSDELVTPDYVQVSDVRTALQNIAWSDPAAVAASSTTVKNVKDPITVTPSDAVRVFTGVDTIDVGGVHIQRGDKYLTVVAGPTADKSAVDVYYRSSELGDWRHAAGPTATIDRDGSLPVNVTSVTPSMTLTDAFSLTVPAYDGSSGVMSWCYLLVVSGTGSQIVPVPTAGAHVLRTGSLLYVDGTVVADSVGSVSVCASAGSPRPTVSTGSASGWVDYYAGWRLPAASGLSWTPGHLTRSVSMDVRISGGQTLTLAPAGVGPAMVTRTDGGMVGVSASEGPIAPLGAYDWVRVTGTAVTSMSYQASGSGELFPTVSMSYNGSSPVVYVESAAIYAGSYAVARDAVIDMGALYPGWSSWKIQIAAGASPSPGASIDVGGNSYAVDADARTLTVGGTVVTIDNLSVLSAGGRLYVAGIDVGESDASTVRLGGSWVAAVTASQMTERTEVAHDWAPGMFSASSELFGAIGILMCIVTFVGLSLVGRRSAVKTIALAGVCGFAAYILYTVMRMKKLIILLALIAVASAVSLMAVSVAADDADAANPDTNGTLSYYNEYHAGNWPDNQTQVIPGTATAVTWTLSDKVPVRDGYTFVHWDVSVFKQNAIHYGYFDPGATITIDLSVWDGSRVIAEAVWEAVWSSDGYSYDLVFHAPGAGNVPGTMTVRGSSEQLRALVPSTVPSMDGMRFLGWSLTDGGSVRYQPGGSIVMTGDTALYAVWTPATASPAGIGEEQHGAPAAIDRIADALGVSGAVVGMALLLSIWAAALAVMHNFLGTRRGGAYALVPMALGALALVALGAIDAALGVLIAAISILMTAVTVKTAAA